MCGIIAYVGKKNVAPLLLEGLRALEYRGYDSAGVYVAGKGVLKRVGKVANLAEAVPEAFTGTAGIAHTRWATHGAPTEENAHPHTDVNETVYLVHNGIIENHTELRQHLENEGVQFRSETDTEVLAQLIAKEYSSDSSLEEAVVRALAHIRGTYGIAVASPREPEKIVVARLGSPLMIGIAKDGYHIASDATPILPHTRSVVYLDDGEMAILTPTGYRIQSNTQKSIERAVEILDWEMEAAQKKGFDHFMLKEIMEIPEVITNALRGRVLAKHGEITLGGLRDVQDRLAQAERIIITGCGSAYYAGLVGQELIEELAGIPVEVETASELRYRRATFNARNTILIAISQSGETADTLEAIRLAKREGVFTLGIVNAVGSTIARETDAGVYNHAGPEIGVASTKGFVSQTVVLSELAILLGRTRGLTEKQAALLTKELVHLPEYAQAILDRAPEVERIAKRFAKATDMLYVGRKFQCPIAYEGALKLKEVSYIHAEAYGAGEMKHGPLALIDKHFPTVALVPKDSLYEKTKSNLAEIKARGGPLIAITTDGNEEMSTFADACIFVPNTREELLPILTTIPLQLFAYYVARERGLPIDMPRNLAKSVTVE